MAGSWLGVVQLWEGGDDDDLRGWNGKRDGYVLRLVCIFVKRV